MTIHKVPMVKSNVKEKMYGIEGLVIEEMVTKADHEAALREKDHAIQQIREHEYQAGFADGSALIKKDYDDLLQQAVRFAVFLDGIDTYDKAIDDAVEFFLNSPDVQARQKEQG